MPRMLTVIVGCMFSGKSEELLRQMKRATIANLTTAVFKPALDTRATTDQICSRDGRCMDAITVHSARGILSAADRYDVIGIDESQFFDGDIVAVVLELYGAGKRVVVAGLDADFRGEPFGHTHRIMAIPEAHIVKLRAVCMRCGLDASRTHRKIHTGAQVEIGDADKYEALCYACYAHATSPEGIEIARTHIAA
ncbi:MAG: thymidine kinase [Candidatus Uhrbacteria bacterium]